MNDGAREAIVIYSLHVHLFFGIGLSSRPISFVGKYGLWVLCRAISSLFSFSFLYSLGFFYVDVSSFIDLF